MSDQTSQQNTPDENSATPASGIIPGKVIVPVGKMRSIMWCVVVLSGMVCSFLLATSLFGIFGSTSVTLFGSLATWALAATLFSLSKDDVVLVDRKEDQAKEESVTKA